MQVMGVLMPGPGLVSLLELKQTWSLVDPRWQGTQPL